MIVSLLPVARSNAASSISAFAFFFIPSVSVSFPHLSIAPLVVHMPVPDLPVELWMQIMLHLTPNEATKLMGVSSTLCQLALDYKYEVLCLHGTSPGQIRSLERLG